jgi:hypothetical protein
MSEVLELSEETYRLLADVAKQQQRSLEEMLYICLLAYEERCSQQADHQMLA